VLFPAPRPVRQPDPSLGELLPFGSTVALWAPPPDGAPVVVHFHGNGEQLADLAHVVSALRAQRFGVLAVEYPGYGLAPGAPSEASLLRAGEDALVSLERQLPADRIVLEGQSLGSAVATQLAARGHGSRLVLISPFTSVPAVAAKSPLFRPFTWLVRDRFDTAAAARSVPQPVLIVHGTDDAVVPYSMGAALDRAFTGARLVPIPGGQHNDPWTSHRTEVVGAIARFVASRR
jgi:pimeloyl-ACP methyl ester carboxylesterase